MFSKVEIVGDIVKNKGQALVEFVLVLPVLLLLIFAFFDISRIMLGKNHLESVMDEVATLVHQDKSVNEINNFLKNDDYDITCDINNQEYTNITLKTTIDLITPGMKRILDNPYTIKIERSIIDE